MKDRNEAELRIKLREIRLKEKEFKLKEQESRAKQIENDRSHALKVAQHNREVQQAAFDNKVRVANLAVSHAFLCKLDKKVDHQIFTEDAERAWKSLVDMTGLPGSTLEQSPFELSPVKVER